MLLTLSLQVLLATSILGQSSGGEEYTRLVWGSRTEESGIKVGPFAKCLSGTAVRGFRLKWVRVRHGHAGVMDKGLKTVRFYCGVDHQEIKSLEGRLGVWGPKQTCPSPGFGVGMALQTTGTGVTNLRLDCSNNEIVEGKVTDAMGEWRASTSCDRGYYLCGFNTFMEAWMSRWGRGDLRMAGIAILCCSND